MPENATSSCFTRRSSKAARIGIPAILLTLAITAAAPRADAGVLWAGLGFPISYVYNPYGFYGAPTAVYNPFWYYFSGFPWYGYAQDYTYFRGFSPFYTNPWVWGFWDPPDNGNINTTIEYDEVFTGLDANGQATGLSGLEVASSDIIGNRDGTDYQGQVFHTTLGQISSLANPTNLLNIDTLLGAAIQNNPNASVDFVKYTVPISQIAQAAPEPANLFLFAGGGLLILAGRWRRRKRAPQ